MKVNINIFQEGQEVKALKILELNLQKIEQIHTREEMLSKEKKVFLLVLIVNIRILLVFIKEKMKKEKERKLLSIIAIIISKDMK